ncbi:MAG: heavy metal translocating P-type ATPase [Lachnospiraceae bacterium]|nr:heavy metal translocating P-type ATPase [Lachnospiraceae bacterium]
MEQYKVTGMSCAACQQRVEKAVSKVKGVTLCNVSLLTNSMAVEGTASPADIISAVENAGYGAAPAMEEKKSGSMSAKIAAEEDMLKDKTTPLMKKRLFASVIFLLILMYFSMGAHMWGWPVPAFMQGNHVAMGLMEMLLAGIIMVINQKFFISGFKSLFHLAPNMDSTIALGSAAAFIYSTVMLFAMTRAQVDGGSAAAAPYMNEFYFESAGMILTLITIGKTLEAYSKGKTTDALKSLMKLAPKTANVVRDGVEMTVSIDDVQKGDTVLVRPGENIPVDGIVLEGNSAVNESALTGESIPVDKQPGSNVSSATLNQSGLLKIQATRVGEDTTLSQIITMVSDAAATKAPVAKLADKISGVFVPCVIGIALFTIIVWLLVGADAGFALARGICVLVVSCPCALGLATPVAIMVGNGLGAKNGVLFKTAEALQETGNVQIIALDKTGTITKGEPQVTDILPADGMSSEELVRLSAGLEAGSEHPLAKAVMKYAEEKNIKAVPAADFTALPGNGLKGTVEGAKMIGGSARFVSGLVKLNDSWQQKADQLAADGKTPLFFMRGGKFIGIIAVADTIKEDSARAVKELRNMGIHVVMLTGDNERTAGAIGRQAGVNEVIAGVLPDGKQAVIKELQKKGKVAMVGDGINDAPALTQAQIGIAIGAGTDVAIDAADVVLMKSGLSDVSAAVRLSRQTYRNIVENLFWALFYNVLLIPLAAGAYSYLFGLNMNPMWGAAAMSCSSVFVVCNALRLNLFDMHSARHDRKIKHPVQTDANGFVLEHKENTEVEEKNSGKDDMMTKTIKIDGMMCGHCEATVKKALEALDGVESAQVSHTAGQAVVELSKDVDNDVLTKAVEDKDYKVTAIQ